MCLRILNGMQGYLGQVLRESCGLEVVGVEREEERVAAAKRRAGNSDTLHLDLSDSEESRTNFAALLHDISRNSRPITASK